MSWFDATGLASIAKSALKEVQRNIDKALDIKEDAENIAPANTPIDTNSDDFFATWGVGQQQPTIKDVNKDNSENKMSSSIWGSFTGSFFDTTSKEPKSASIDSLDDSTDIKAEHFNQSKLVVQYNEDDKESPESASDKEAYLQMEDVAQNQELEATSSNQSLSVKREKPSSPNTHRLSILSSESGKNSGSESVDIITCSTECTTTPDSEILSHSVSNSSSALGLKHTSESVEILAESLTSPSSVEVLGSDSTDSRRYSQQTDEYVSPLESPCPDEKTSQTEKVSPDSVEVIPEDQDENSIAEDTMSYTSISESTSATVLDTVYNLHVKPPKMLKDTFNRVESDNISTDLMPSPDKNINIAEAITRAPSRSAMHLPLPQVNQMLIDTQPQSTRDISNIIETTNIIDIPQDEEKNIENLLETSTDDGSQSDKTMIASENAMESSSDASTTTETSSNSTYLKNMLADAMAERSTPELEKSVVIGKADSVSRSMMESSTLSQIEFVGRDTSPLSSEKSSDLVKIGSDQTSCHTSGDELETTTSSDIEIISSPNGDSSSTQSRQSPAKHTLLAKAKPEDSLLHKITTKKVKGHNRELSEASSISDDSHSSEVDRLLKRISEMTEILECRESKLIDMNRRSAELQELNNDLRQQLDTILTKQLESANLSQVTEEYTQRLSALEKKFQQAIREKDTLRKQVEQSKQEAATRISTAEMESIVAEKDEVIKELREEGEKLSKQQLQHSNIIKKLRSKEKENELTIKHLRETIESLSTESDRLKKSLSAKEEVERSQIEAVHQLTTKNKKLESEVSKLKGQIDDLTQKYDTTKTSLEAAKKELIDKNRASSELLAREQLLENLESQKRMTESQNEEVINQLEDLRYKLRNSDEEFVKKEQKLRQENSELLRRLEQAETRNEELCQSVVETSKPLMRQLESLQSMHNMKMANFEKVEQELRLKIGEMQSKLHNASTTERVAKEECIAMRSKLADIEGQLSSMKHEAEMLKVYLEQSRNEKQLSEQELKSQIDTLNDIIKQNKICIEDHEKEIMSLQQQLSLEKSSNEMQRKQAQVSMLQTQEVAKSSTEKSSPPRSASNSPTLSLGKASVADSMGSSFWSQQDEPFDVSQAPRYTNMFEMQILQSNLKQREGEVQQLQWELNRRERERSLLNSDISNLLIRVEELEANLTEFETMKVQFADLQKQYDTLCQLYGEKVEENEELKLDLEDVKDMYKGQIDELLRQQQQRPNA